MRTPYGETPRSSGMSWLWTLTFWVPSGKSPFLEICSDVREMPTARSLSEPVLYSQVQRQKGLPVSVMGPGQHLVPM